MISDLPNRYSVQSWWDCQTCIWITSILDDRGYQVGDAEFAPNKASMQVNHDLMIADALKMGETA